MLHHLDHYYISSTSDLVHSESLILYGIGKCNENIRIYQFPSIIIQQKITVA
jgi:hypothetical protein